MYNIKTFNKISNLGLQRFPASHYQVGSDIERPTGYLLRSHKLHGDLLPDTLQAVARAGAGVNNIPVEDCTRRGIVVFNTPGANANAVKELVLAGLLLGSRDILGGVNYVNTLTDITDATAMSQLLEAEKKRFAGNELMGKSFGVVGLGAIGSMVAEMALALDMKVVGYDPALSVEAAWRLPSQVQRMENLQSLLSASDYVSLHVPAVEATHHMINSESLASLRKGAVLLNFAREAIVDSRAIVAALETGQLRRYVCDFPEPCLLGRSGVIAMPHIGASTAEAEDNCAVMAAEQLMDYLENGNIRNSVNFPPISMARNNGTRLAFGNENVSGVLGHVLSILAYHQVNVLDMVNKSRDQVAYNIIDLEQAPDTAVIESIRKVEHVIKVRVLA